MTDKKLKVGNTAYTELSIQIGVLEAKVDKLLTLLMADKATITVGDINIDGDYYAADALEEHVKLQLLSANEKFPGV